LRYGPPRLVEVETLVVVNLSTYFEDN
jgi:hypothetical protein